MREDSEQRDFARNLRKQMNDAEAALWNRLRDRKQNRFKFRRQHTLGPYFADFWCSIARVVVELDGYSHSESKGHDERRDAWMAERKILVLRFSNQQLEASIESVLQTIRAACEERIA
ncbi:MAG: hypothetical protein C0483_09405 [Pirellula sp.]|nr:hypothetical protein [Pirellula sp.]